MCQSNSASLKRKVLSFLLGRERESCSTTSGLQGQPGFLLLFFRLQPVFLCGRYHTSSSWHFCISWPASASWAYYIDYHYLAAFQVLKFILFSLFLWVYALLEYLFWCYFDRALGSKHTYFISLLTQEPYFIFKKKFCIWSSYSPLRISGTLHLYLQQRS